jgi:hypothetical protein
MSGLGKQMRGSGIAKIQNQSTPFEEGGRADYVKGGGAKVGEVKVKIPPYLKKGMVKMGFKKGGAALKKVDKEKNPGLSKLPTEVRNKMGYMKKGGSAKPGLWANINRRKKLGISRPKSKSTISAKAYANMKAGFPKKK